MHIDSHLQIGQFHTNFCEDFLLIETPDPSLSLAAIMDGCSMGNDSHFASVLFAKILRKIIRTLPFEAMHDPAIPALAEWTLPALGKEVLKRLWQDLRLLQNRLFLDKLELLCTLHLALIRPAQAEAWSLLVGDGVFALDDEIIEIDQGNRPDYLAYHLSGDFDSWFANQEAVHQKLEKSFLMASDGILAFEKLIPEKESLSESIPAFLLRHQPGSKTKNALRKKVKTLQEDFGLIPTDDLSLIQFVW